MISMRYLCIIRLLIVGVVKRPEREADGSLITHALYLGELWALGSDNKGRARDRGGKDSETGSGPKLPLGF